MDRKKFLIKIVILMFLIFIADRVGTMFYWYYTIWWFDMLMHFLGGVWVGLFFLYVFYNKNKFLEQFLIILSCVLLIGVFYELFEVYVHNYIARDPFNILDTTSDIFFDLAGGVFALLYFLKKNRQTGESEIHPTVEL
jgi:hypothetical protein